MKTIFVLCYIFTFVMFVFLLLLGINKFSNTDTSSAIDALSFHVLLLTTVLTVLTLGGGMVAFIGWQEIRRVIEEKTKAEVNNFLNTSDVVSEHVSQYLKKLETADNVYKTTIQPKRINGNDT